MTAFVATIALATYRALQDGPPDATKWWPYLVGLFANVGLSALAWSFTLETIVLEIAAPSRAELTRGPFWNRQRIRLDRVVMTIKEGQDSDGDAYFMLEIDAPSRRAVIAESDRRDKLEAIKLRVEQALSR